MDDCIIIIIIIKIIIILIRNNNKENKNYNIGYRLAGLLNSSVGSKSKFTFHLSDFYSYNRYSYSLNFIYTHRFRMIFWIELQEFVQILFLLEVHNIEYEMNWAKPQSQTNDKVTKDQQWVFKKISRIADTYTVFRQT